MISLLLHNHLNIYNKLGDRYNYKMKDKNNTLNSIAIWWTKKEEKEVNVHLDINIWHTKESKGNYLEFGIKIDNYRAINAIYIYIPYLVGKKDIEDKASILASDNTLTNAMFNEKLDVSKGEGSFHTVKFSNTKKFQYCKLDVTNDINIKKKIIELDIKEGGDNSINTVYYRFRINKVEKIFTELKENYFWIDGFFKTVGFLELNINSVRKLPDTVVDKLGGVTFNSMNLFLMTDNFTNFIYQSRDAKKSRILENHIWDNYLDESNSKKINKIIAYHWKKEDKKGRKTIPFEDYNLFVKISYIRKGLLSWLSMIVLVLGFGIISGVSGNYITKKLFDNFSDDNKTTQSEDNQTARGGDKNGTK